MTGAKIIVGLQEAIAHADNNNLVTYKITFPVIECRKCGVRTWQGVCVFGAVGHYCKGCAETVALFARMNRERQISDWRKTGVIRIPTDPYDPKTDTTTKGDTPCRARTEGGE